MTTRGQMIGAGIDIEKNETCEWIDEEKPFWSCPYSPLKVEHIDGQPDRHYCFKHMMQYNEWGLVPHG